MCQDAGKHSSQLAELIPACRLVCPRMNCLGFMCIVAHVHLLYIQQFLFAVTILYIGLWETSTVYSSLNCNICISDPVFPGYWWHQVFSSKRFQAWWVLKLDLPLPSLPVQCSTEDPLKCPPRLIIMASPGRGIWVPERKRYHHKGCFPTQILYKNLDSWTFVTNQKL